MMMMIMDIVSSMISQCFCRCDHQFCCDFLFLAFVTIMTLTVVIIVMQALCKTPRSPGKRTTSVVKRQERAAAKGRPTLVSSSCCARASLCPFSASSWASLCLISSFCCSSTSDLSCRRASTMALLRSLSSWSQKSFLYLKINE